MTRKEICDELAAAGCRLVGAEWCLDARLEEAWLAWRAAGSPAGATVVIENGEDGREVVRVESDVLE
jgi:hypothetical protein